MLLCVIIVGAYICTDSVLCMKTFVLVTSCDSVLTYLCIIIYLGSSHLWGHVHVHVIITC